MWGDEARLARIDCVAGRRKDGESRELMSNVIVVEGGLALRAAERVFSISIG